jgi:hypothetical protein
MTGPSDPSPPDLWTRLALLNECCEVRLSTEPEPREDGSWRWVCVVVIRPRYRAVGEEGVISVFGARASEALAQALDLAERRGWGERPGAAKTGSSAPKVTGGGDGPAGGPSGA